MKFYYMHVVDPKSENLVTVTFAYEGDKYSFSVKSPKDNFVKKVGRTIAAGRLAKGKSYKFITNEELGVVGSLENSFITNIMRNEINVPHYLK